MSMVTEREGVPLSFATTDDVSDDCAGSASSAGISIVSTSPVLFLVAVLEATSATDVAFDGAAFFFVLLVAVVDACGISVCSGAAVTTGSFASEAGAAAEDGVASEG